MYWWEKFLKPSEVDQGVSTTQTPTTTQTSATQQWQMPGLSLMPTVPTQTAAPTARAAPPTTGGIPPFGISPAGVTAGMDYSIKAGQRVKYGGDPNEYILKPSEYMPFEFPREEVKTQTDAQLFQLSARGLTREQYASVIEQWKQRQIQEGNYQTLVDMAQSYVKYGYAESVDQWVTSELGDEAGIRLLGLPSDLAHELADRYTGVPRARQGLQGAAMEPEHLISTPTSATQLRQSFIEALKPVTKTNIDTMLLYYQNNPEALRATLIGEGRNTKTEQLAKALYPGIGESQLADLFSMDALVVEQKAKEMAEQDGGGLRGTFTAGVGDLVANTGGILRWAGAEGIGAKLTRLGQFMRVQAAPVPFQPDEFTWRQLFNPQFWATYGVRMLPTLMVLLIPGLGGYGLAAKGVKALHLATKFGRAGKFITAALSGMGAAALSRPLESAMEAGNAYDMARQEGRSHEEANSIADKVFSDNMKLIGLDAAQWAVAFAPTGGIGNAAMSAARKGLVKVTRIGGKMFATGLTEGGEEVYQEMVQKWAMGKKVNLKDPEMQLVFSLGAAAGLGFGAFGDIMTNLQGNISDKLTPNQRTKLNRYIQEARDAGKAEEMAVVNGLSRLTEEENINGVIKDAAKDTEKAIAQGQVEWLQDKSETVTGVTPTITGEVPGVEFRLITTKVGQGYEIVQNNEVVGEISYATNVPGVNGIVIDRIDIAETARRQGLATQAIQRILSEAESQGVPLYTGLLEADGVQLFNALQNRGIINLTPAPQRMLGETVTRGVPEYAPTTAMAEGETVSGQPTPLEIRNWQDMGLTNEDIAALKLMSPELRELTTHQARLTGFRGVSNAVVDDYLQKALKLAQKANNTKAIESLQSAIEYNDAGILQNAILDSEKGLGYLHQDELATLRDAEKVAAEALELPTPAVKPTTPIDSIIRKLTNVIRSAKPARAETELLKTAERARRVPKMKEAALAARPEEAAFAAMGQLKGELPKAQFTPPETALSEGDVRALYGYVRERLLMDGEDAFKWLNTDAALRKLLAGEIPTRGELALLEDVFGPDLVEAILSKRPLSEKALEAFLDILNIPRSILASCDFSAWLRQGAFIVTSQPKIGGMALAVDFKTLFSGKYTREIDQFIRTGKYAPLREKAKLYLAPVEGTAATKLSQREEMFISRLVKKIPIIGHGVKWSERAYVSTLNYMRAMTFDHYAARWERQGYSPETYRQLATLINWATGRGPIGKLANMTPLLNALFFATRLQTSRAAMLMGGAKFTSPPVRKAYARMMVSFFGTMGSIVALGALAGLWEPEKDPRSSGFGKIRIGNTRLDPWAGFLPIARLIAHLVTGTRKTATGRIQNISRMETVERFLRSKASPAFGLAWDITEGETFIGEALSLEAEGIGEQAYQRLTPLFIQDLIDAIKEEGWLGGFIAIPGAFGVGVVSYPGSIDAYERHVSEIPEDMLLNWQKGIQVGGGELTYENLNTLQRAWLRRHCEEISDTPERREAGQYNFYEAQSKTYEEFDALLNEEVQSVVEGYKAGEISLSDYIEQSEYLRNKYFGQASRLWLDAMRQKLDPLLHKNLERWHEEEIKPEDVAYEQYMELRANPPKISGVPDWDAWDKALSDFMDTQSEEVRDYIEQRRTDWINKLSPERQPIERLVLDCESILDDYYAVDSKERAEYRDRHPEVDARLIILRDLKPRTGLQQAYALLQQYGVSTAYVQTQDGKTKSTTSKYWFGESPGASLGTSGYWFDKYG